MNALTGVLSRAENGQNANARLGMASVPNSDGQPGRIVIVSNRVDPISSLKGSPGGLAIAMKEALAHTRALWFGWSGEISDGPAQAPRSFVNANITRALIDLSRDDFAGYYAGFANRALWPLFHYRISMVECSHEDYRAYWRVNSEFAKHLAPLLAADDLIWIHDYHLIPLASELRALGVKQPIGFFLHTPFPGPDVLTTLPVHADIVQMMCQYDLLGFQTDADARSFCDYVTRESGGSVSRNGAVHAFGRHTRVGAFPIGIDAAAVAARARNSLGSMRGRRLRDSLTGRKLIIGVDRLDYTKGLIQRFKGIELLLESHAELSREAVVLQIATPTRGEVPEYRQLRLELNQLIGHINGRFGDPDVLPVRYLNKQFGQYILFGFFRLSAVGCVTPLRDGMNLVAKEYVASQDPENPGVLVLSRFAGAAQQLGAAVIVNPFDPREVADAVYRGLSMPIEERRERHTALMTVLERYDIRNWRNTYLSALVATTSRRRRAPKSAARSDAGRSLCPNAV